MKTFETGTLGSVPIQHKNDTVVIGKRPTLTIPATLKEFGALATELALDALAHEVGGAAAEAFGVVGFNREKIKALIAFLQASRSLEQGPPAVAPPYVTVAGTEEPFSVEILEGLAVVDPTETPAFRPNKRPHRASTKIGVREPTQEEVARALSVKNLLVSEPKLSQRGISTRLGIDLSSVQRILTGKTRAAVLAGFEPKGKVYTKKSRASASPPAASPASRRKAQRDYRLTPDKVEEIRRLKSEGKSNHEVARLCGVAESTVTTHARGLGPEVFDAQACPCGKKVRGPSMFIHVQHCEIAKAQGFVPSGAGSTKRN